MANIETFQEPAMGEENTSENIRYLLVCLDCHSCALPARHPQCKYCGGTAMIRFPSRSYVSWWITGAVVAVLAVGGLYIWLW
jgi:hypothetical protein